MSQQELTLVDAGDAPIIIEHDDDSAGHAMPSRSASPSTSYRCHQSSATIIISTAPSSSARHRHHHSPALLARRSGVIPTPTLRPHLAPWSRSSIHAHHPSPRYHLHPRRLFSRHTHHKLSRLSIPRSSPHPFASRQPRPRRTSIDGSLWTITRHHRLHLHPGHSSMLPPAVYA